MTNSRIELLARPQLDARKKRNADPNEESVDDSQQGRAGHGERHCRHDGARRQEPFGKLDSAEDNFNRSAA